MLHIETRLPENSADGTPVVVLLHGRGANEHDLLGLHPFLPPGVALVLPRAPFPGARWGYGPGWAWYRYLGEDRPEPASFSASLDEIDALLDGLPALLGFAPGLVALGGFSQGGTLSAAYALTRPGSVPLVLNFSGFVAAHPDVRVAPRTVAGTRFFWGHGTSDPAIPFALAERGRAILREAGADLEARDYLIGHWIDPVEIRDAVAWLECGIEFSKG